MLPIGYIGIAALTVHLVRPGRGPSGISVIGDNGVESNFISFRWDMSFISGGDRVVDDHRWSLE